MWKMCRKMSKENYFIKKTKKAQRTQQYRRRSLREVLRAALQLVREDIRAYGLAVAIFSFV